jgi:hypothetical protein
VARVSADSRVTLHPLAIRESDDDPDTFVVGRRDGGGYVELPGVGVAAIRLLDQGLTVDAVEGVLGDGDDRPDVLGLVDTLVDLDWVSTLDGAPLPDPIGAARVQFGWLRPGHLRWLVSRPVAVAYAALLAVTAVTVIAQPGLLPSYRSFFWTDYPGVAALGNVLMFVAGASVHELMHLAAARSLGLPARIGLGTRLYNLALQTDVSAAWTVPRRQRYRIYLAGMAWDTAAICACLLVCAYADPAEPLRRLLAAFVLIAAIGIVLQAQLYMRTDLYFVAMDLLRCGDLFHDGLAYARYRLALALRRRPRPADPSRELPARERRAVRVYAPLVVAGSTAALATYGLVGVPVLVESSVRAATAVGALFTGGSVLAAIDGALVLIVQWGLQVMFLVTFRRSHPTWFRWGSANPEGR